MSAMSSPARFIWPGNARCAVVVCFDVDGETTAMEHGLHMKDRLTTWSQCAYGPRVGVPRILAMLEDLQIHATFFIPAYIADQHPRMTEAVAERGHEIGVHGDRHEKLVGLSIGEKKEILHRSINTLQRLTGKRPIGYRAPWFEMNSWTPDLLVRFGFKYSACGMGDDVPYRHDCGLIEIPGQWFLEDWEHFSFNADPEWGHQPRSAAEVRQILWEEFDAMHSMGCCFVLTLHPWLIGRPGRIKMLEASYWQCGIRVGCGSLELRRWRNGLLIILTSEEKQILTYEKR